MNRLGASARRSLRAVISEVLEGRTLLSAGDLDPTFGVGGVASATYTASLDDVGNSIAVMADGRFVVAGTSDGGSPQIAVARFKADGSPDPTFDHDGKTLLNLGQPSKGVKVVALPNGKLLIGGDVIDPETPEDFGPPPVATIVRLNADGSLDRSFDGDGHVELRKLGHESKLTSLATGPGGVIYVTADAASDGLKLCRLKSNGDYDTSFGNGSVVTGVGGAVAVDSSGRIIVGGGVFSAVQTQVNFLRFKPNGQPDDSFGIHGTASIATPFLPLSDSALSGITIAADGDIVAGGSADTPDDVYVAYAIRLNANGSPDAQFGDHGVVFKGFANQPVVSSPGFVLTSDGHVIMTVVNAFNNLFERPGSTVIRFDRRGQFDSAFGDAPVVDSSFEGILPHPETAQAIALGKSGQILIAGTLDRDLAIAAYRKGNGKVDPTFALGGRRKVDFVGNVLATPIASARTAAGAVFVAGTLNVQGTEQIFVSRFKPSGQLDTSFGSGGTTLIGLGDVVPQLLNLFPRPTADGGITIGFNAAQVREIVNVNGIYHLRANGTIDTGFATNGLLTLADVTNLTGLEVDRKGRILVAGVNLAGLPFVARFDSAGKVDSRYGMSHGRTTFGFASEFGSKIVGLSFATDGSVIANAQLDPSATASRYMVVKLTETGRFDGSFGRAGKVILSPPLGGSLFSQFSQSDRRVSFDGSYFDSVLGFRQFILRLKSNGQIDTTVAPDGLIVLPDVPDGSFDRFAYDAAGRILAVVFHNSDGEKYSVGRLLPNGNWDTSFSSDGQTNITADLIAQVIPEPGHILVIGSRILADGTSTLLVKKLQA